MPTQFSKPVLRLIIFEKLKFVQRQVNSTLCSYRFITNCDPSLMYHFYGYRNKKICRSCIPGCGDGDTKGVEEEGG